MKKSPVFLILLAAALVVQLVACGAKAPTWQDEYDLGCRYLSDGNYQEAILAFTAAIQIDPAQPLAYIGRADAYCMAPDTNYPQAEEDYRTAISLDPSIPEIYEKLAELYHKIGDPEAAREILEEGFQHTGDSGLLAQLDALDAAYRQVTITFERQDHSLYSQEDPEGIELYFDLAVVSEDYPLTGTLNANLYHLYENYLQDVADSGIEDFLGNKPYPAKYSSTYTGSISYNGNGVLSVLYQAFWFAGGVANQIPYGYTFDLRTGAPAKLEDLFSMDPAALLAHIRQTVLDYASENLMTDDYMQQQREDYVANYTLDTLNYCIDATGQLVICVPVYALGYGAEGSQMIPCGLFLSTDDQSGSPSGEILPADFIGLPPSALFDYYGTDYIMENYAGSTFLIFDGSPEYYFGEMVVDYLGEPVTEISDDLLIRQVIAYDRHILVDNIPSAATYPELVAAVGDAVTLEEPTYYFNEMDDRYAYSLSFYYKEYHFSYTWYEDPMTSPSASVWLQNTNVPVVPGA